MIFKDKIDVCEEDLLPMSYTQFELYSKFVDYVSAKEFIEYIKNNIDIRDIHLRLDIAKVPVGRFLGKEYINSKDINKKLFAVRLYVARIENKFKDFEFSYLKLVKDK